MAAVAEAVWRRQVEAGQRGAWDEVQACFAPECTWTLWPPGRVFQGRSEVLAFLRSGMGAAATRQAGESRGAFACDPWGVFEYTSRGVADADRARAFAQMTGLSDSFAGGAFAVAVCFIWHVDDSGQIDAVREYAGLVAPSAGHGSVGPPEAVKRSRP